MKAINNSFVKARKERGVLVAAHRGMSGGNVIQNTIMAYESAIQHGADIMEMDVIMSKDHVFYAFHNGKERILFGSTFDIRNMTSVEIDSFTLQNTDGENSGLRLSRVEDILSHFDHRCLFNIDRSWFYWEDMIAFIEQHPMRDYIVVKSTPSKELLEILMRVGKHVNYMPILTKAKEWELVEQYDVQCIAAEIVFATVQSEIAQPSFIKRLHDQDVLAWGNSILYNGEVKLAAGLDDNQAIMGKQEESWGRLMDMGFDIIQTDWPYVLKKFITNRKLR